MLKTFIFATITAIATANSNADDVNKIFGDSDQWKTGLINIHKDDDIFYWLFQSRQETASTDPLVLWLTGGPGCASEVALFNENGPYQFGEDGAIKSNPNSWNNISNLLYVDQPIGTGFSHAGFAHDETDETEIAEDMALFFRGFLEANPEYIDRDFYVTGESYAGHYVPAIAYHLQKVATDVKLNLKGIAIGNGLTDPFLQYPAYATFSHENGLISDSWNHVMEIGLKGCQALIYETENGGIAKIPMQLAALEYCQILVESVLGNPLKPAFNVYDIRIPCKKAPLCYDFSASDELLNRKDVQEVLGVKGRKWKDCNMLVHTFLLGDWMTNLMPQIAEMLDTSDLEVLVYSGDKDWICNWRGGEAWTLGTKWSNKRQFNKQEYESWEVNGTPAGAMRQYKNLHFLRVFDAGHMVPMDQPENALAMMDRFIRNDWNLSSGSQIIQ